MPERNGDFGMADSSSAWRKMQRLRGEGVISWVGFAMMVQAVEPGDSQRRCFAGKLAARKRASSRKVAIMPSAEAASDPRGSAISKSARACAR